MTQDASAWVDAQDPAVRLGSALIKAGAAALAVAEAALAPLGLTARQYSVLAVLVRAPKLLSQTEAAGQAHLDGRTMVFTIDALEALGAVERRRDPTDRRKHALQVTAAGAALMDQATAALSTAQSHYLAALTPGRQSTLAQSLTTLLDSLPTGG